jgi:hypothetical protein
MPSTSASTTNPAPFYQHSWKKRGKRRLWKRLESR